MKTKPNSPAERLHGALSDAALALHQMTLAGAPLEAIQECDSQLEALTLAAAELPDRIANGNTPHCEGCIYLMHSIDPEPYGDTEAERETFYCTAGDATQCPTVNACGYVAWIEEAYPIPAFLRKQAD